MNHNNRTSGVRRPLLVPQDTLKIVAQCAKVTYLHKIIICGHIC